MRAYNFSKIKAKPEPVRIWLVSEHIYIQLARVSLTFLQLLCKMPEVAVQMCTCCHNVQALPGVI